MTRISRAADRPTAPVTRPSPSRKIVTMLLSRERAVSATAVRDAVPAPMIESP